MLIGVDASALATPGNGIGRYLQALLPRLASADSRHWRWYARTRALPATLAACDRANVIVRADRLPRDAGRILALGSSLPWWVWRDRPDLFWGPAHRLPLALPASCARVVTIHDLCWRRVPETMRTSTRRLDAALMPRALVQADRIIAVSNSTKDDLLDFMPQLEGRVVVVAEAADSVVAEPEPRTDGRPFILAVGTREPRKNLARLIQAYSRLGPALRASTRLVIAGGGGWNDDSQDAAVRFGVRDEVEFLGAVGERQLSSLYRHATFLAMPSLYEGFGLPILESLSHGTPVLFGDNSSMRDVAGDAGLGVDAASVDSIAAGLARLLNDRVFRDRLAANAKPQAARFSWDRAARETLAVFDEAIAARQARSA